MSQPTAPQRGERVRIVLETTFSCDASDSLGVVYVIGLNGPGGANGTGTFGLPAADIVSVEVITPPKPPEPKGWGAVVEDNTGAYWTLYAPEAGVWINYAEGKRHYHSIPAVRIVSEGVTA